jgi:hypothetical protein
MPGDRPIYFSVDFDATPGQQAAIDSYFDGVASVLGVDRVGAYGGYYVIQRLLDHSKIRWGWQTYAWSGGQWDARAQLRQIQNGVTVAGADCDIDQAMAADFGQWGPNTAAPGSPAEGSQAFLSPHQQHYMTTTGDLRHQRMGPSGTSRIDTWAPVSLVDRDVCVRRRSTRVRAWHRGHARASSSRVGHGSTTTWASGIAATRLRRDPRCQAGGDRQCGRLQHWWWSGARTACSTTRGPRTSSVAERSARRAQTAFARGGRPVRRAM